MDVQTSLRYDDLCMNLNIDRNTRTQAWATFVKIAENFTLEGDELQWLVCSLYDHCRRDQQLLQQHIKPKRSCVTLTRILRSAKDRVHFNFPRLRLLKADEPEAEKWKCVLSQFITTLRNWTEMVACDEEERFDSLIRVDRLERVFSVSTVVFKKLKSIFETVFAPMEPLPAEKEKSKKDKRRRRTQCTTRELFAFCWTVYVLVKGTFPAIGDDLVNSFHLLICCVDWLFADALVGHRSDLLNPRFPLLPEEFSEETNIDPDEHCIVEYLCQHYDGVVMEARIIKLYWWRLAIDKLVRRKVLRGSGELAEGVLELGNFDANFRCVNLAYEEHVMTVGDFDERVYLGDNRGNKIVVVKTEPEDEVDSDAVVEVVSSPGNSNRRVSASELLQRASPMPWAREGQESSSPSSKNVAKMLALLHDSNPEPSDNLVKVLESVHSEIDLKQDLQNRVMNLSELAKEAFVENSGQTEVECDSTRKVELTVTLYYRLVESILTTEKDRLKGRTDYIKQLLKTDAFHLSLFACCTELVMFSHHSNTEFPRSLTAFSLSPFEFYKIIEVVVRCENGLWRAAVKHLNSLEENVLESLAWKEEGSLWQQLTQDAYGVPTCEQVTFPSQLENDEKTQRSKSPESLRPDPNTVASTKRRLFTSNTLPTNAGLVTAKIADTNNDQQNSDSNSPPKTFTFQTAVSDDGRPILIPVQLVPIKKTAEVPQRKGQFGIFFRKVYHLASVRLREICERLQIDETLRGKIWTCFEYCMVKNVDLLKGRHLDQILLCSIYIVCKLSEDNFIQFQELITCYRWQPQAKSATYRDIPLNSDQDSLVENKGDLVDFYNQLYVPKMKKFAMKFSYKIADQCPTISRLPLLTAGKKSPRKIGRGRSVYLKSPIKEDSEDSMKRPSTKMRYRFDNSSARDLRRINRMIVEVAQIEQRLMRKRPLEDENANEVDENAQPSAKLAREVASTSSGAPPLGLSGLAAIPALQQKLLSLLSDRNRQDAN